MPLLTCEQSGGIKKWYCDGQLHRDNGPAVEWPNGYKEWYRNGRLHREGGPAVMWVDGTEEWWENGEQIENPSGYKIPQENVEVPRQPMGDMNPLFYKPRTCQNKIITLTCKLCGEKFQGYKNRIFCSKECAGTVHFKKGEANKKNKNLKRVRYTLSSAKIRAKKRGLPYDLDEHEAEILQRFNNGVCELSGIPLDSGKNDKRMFNTPSLDRIDRDKGYVYDNIRIVCWLMNAALSDWGEETLRTVMKSWLGKGPLTPPHCGSPNPQAQGPYQDENLKSL